VIVANHPAAADQAFDAGSWNMGAAEFGVAAPDRWIAAPSSLSRFNQTASRAISQYDEPKIGSRRRDTLAAILQQ